MLKTPRRRKVGQPKAQPTHCAICHERFEGHHYQLRCVDCPDPHCDMQKGQFICRTCLIETFGPVYMASHALAALGALPDTEGPPPVYGLGDRAN